MRGRHALRFVVFLLASVLTVSPAQAFKYKRWKTARHVDLSRYAKCLIIPFSSAHPEWIDGRQAALTVNQALHAIDVVQVAFGDQGLGSVAGAEADAASLAAIGLAEGADVVIAGSIYADVTEQESTEWNILTGNYIMVTRTATVHFRTRVIEVESGTILTSYNASGKGWGTWQKYNAFSNPVSQDTCLALAQDYALFDLVSAYSPYPEEVDEPWMPKRNRKGPVKDAIKFAESGAFESAIPLFRQEAEADPSKSYWQWWNLALALEASGQRQEAIGALESGMSVAKESDRGKFFQMLAAVRGSFDSASVEQREAEVSNTRREATTAVAVDEAAPGTADEKVMHVISATAAEIVIDAGTSKGIAVDDQFFVTAEVDVVGLNGEILGKRSLKIGVLQVVESSELFSICHILAREEGQEFATGQIVNALEPEPLSDPSVPEIEAPPTNF